MQIRQPSGRAIALAAGVRGEIPLAVQPRLGGRVDAGEQRRMNAFAGRALTAPLLHAEQNHRSRHVALLNRALSAGVVEGLGLAFFDADIAAIGTVTDAAPAALDLAAPRRLLLDGGMALSATGEEVVLPQALSFDALDLPVVAPGWLLAGESPLPRPPDADGSLLESRRVGRSLRDELNDGRAVPRVGIVMLEPVEHWQVEGADPFDQCERDLEAEAFEDQQRRDAGRLVYYAWPDEWLALLAPDVAWRNRLVYQIFGREAQLGSARAMPWFEHGVPLALVAFNAAWRPLFADRAAVARSGGRPRGAALLRRPASDEAQQRIAASGDRFLWQARIEQLSEHLNEAQLAGADTTTVSTQFRALPPAGLLPPDAIDVRQRINRFFAPALDVFAAPVPLEQVDLLLEESAGLAPIDTSVRDRLSVFVPVPQQVYEPDLLVIEQADPSGEIGRTLTRFVDARADWLRRRQNLRVKGHVLQLGIDGSATTPPVTPAADDPARLEDETMAALLPAPPGLLHRSALVQGLHQHFFDGATPPLVLPADAMLYAWVLLDRENPPQQLMLQFFSGSWEHRAYWGANLIGWGNDGSTSRLQQAAELPDAGVWTRLQVSAQALGLNDGAITGIAFTLFGGRACFGPAGTLSGAAESLWLNADLLSASQRHGDGEAWDIVAATDREAPFEAAFGTSANANGDASQADAVAELLVDADVRLLKIIPAGTDRGAAPTLATLIGSQGLRATVSDLAARVDEADDALNLGYLRVQTDLYRLRQSVLKQSQATRFAVSPALTQIADLDNATATREQLSDFYQDVRADKTILKRETAVRESAPSPRAGGAFAINTAVFSNSSFSAAAFATPAPAAATSAAFNLRAERFDSVAGGGLFELEVGPRVPTAPPAPTPSTVTGADALTGKAEIRTTSIAARMERPRSIEAKDFTVATRADIIAKLAALGLDMDALQVHGIATPDQFDSTGQPKRGAASSLSALRKINFASVLTDPDPQADKADESAFFFSGVDLSDYSVALLRNAEGIVRRYRDALERMRKALLTAQGLLGQTSARLGVVARELDEARQDVATARALLAEDRRRADALNARRDSIIAEHVKFLAYARVRVAARALGTPIRELDSTLEPDAVPACLADHAEPPDDVVALLGVLRHAPLDWFPALRPHLQLIDQPAFADRLILALQPSAAPALQRQATQVIATTGPSFSATTPLRQASQLAARAQFDSVSQFKQTALPLAHAALQTGAGLRAKVELLSRAASLADLLRAANDRSDLQRRAAQEFERIEAIAACLHARLSGVRAGIRLQWAESFSQFDAARGQLDLGDLSSLPRFAELPRQEREDIRELGAWLRSRADRNNPQAVALLADLVRVCLLAASHSPAGELITGRMVRPQPLNPGLLLQVRPLLPDRVRVGMQVQFFDAHEVAARAVVEDLAGGVASVKVTQTLSLNLATSLATTVHFLAR